MLRSFLVSATPLRAERGFRHLFLVQLVAVVAGQLTAVALAFQTFSLTGSSFQVGAISLVQLVPLAAGAAAAGRGGSIGSTGSIGSSGSIGSTGSIGTDAPEVDPEAPTAPHLPVGTLATGLGLQIAGTLLLVGATGGAGGLGLLYAGALVGALGAGATSTTVTASVPRLLPPERRVAGITLLQMVDQVAMILAPVVAGALLVTLGAGPAFGVAAGLLALGALLLAVVAPDRGRRRPRLRRPSPRPSPGPWSHRRYAREPALRTLGVLRHRPDLRGIFVIDLVATVFGVPRALFPAMAITVFHGGGLVLGLLNAAPAAGALAGATTAGWLAGVRRQGTTITGAVVVWGLAIAAFGLTDRLGPALGLLAVAGWADVVSAVLRSAALQGHTDTHLWSRLAAVQTAVVEGGPRLGDLEAGTVATLTSTTFAVVSGGLVSAVGAVVVATALPAFRRLRAPGRASE